MSSRLFVRLLRRLLVIAADRPGAITNHTLTNLGLLVADGLLHGAVKVYEWMLGSDPATEFFLKINEWFFMALAMVFAVKGLVAVLRHDDPPVAVREIKAGIQQWLRSVAVGGGKRLEERPRQSTDRATAPADSSSGDPR